MLVGLKNIRLYENEIGNKALRLSDLKKNGFNVPDFCVIPSSFFVEHVDGKGIIKIEVVQSLTASIKKSFKFDKYAVRSSALLEDGKEGSHAGQFKTKVAARINDLENAILEIVQQAFFYLNGRMDLFSIIIQEFIEPNYSGITFTRSPWGTREMKIEVAKGRGDNLVGGRTTPVKYDLLWDSPLPKGAILSYQNIDKFKQIEKYYNFPQDIEWCLKNGKLFFLQTRPITNINKNDHEQSLFLDKELRQNKKYFFQKTEISEISPRPRDFTLSLLKKIYGENGPVEKVYEKFKIKYESKNFLKIIGNELYVNKEEELKTLFPAKSYFAKESFKIRTANFKELLATLKNQIRFINIKTVDPLYFIKIIEEKIKTNFSFNSIEEWLDNFFDDYKIVFEINLLTGLLFEHLKRQTKGDIVDILDKARYFDSENYCINFDGYSLIGNSLDVADETNFCKLGKYLKKNNNNGHIDLDKKVESKAKEVLIFERLREYGRWLVVKRINELRNYLLLIAGEKGFKDRACIYFATIDEIKNNNFNEDELTKRKEEYFVYNKFNLPFELKNKCETIVDKSPIGVSAGVAEGLLSDNIAKEEKNIILYTKVLSPDLVKHFGKIKGIISESGGMLSHLSILAREQDVPVIVNVKLKENFLALGDYIRIDGKQGKIFKIS